MADQSRDGLAGLLNRLAYLLRSTMTVAWNPTMAKHRPALLLVAGGALTAEQANLLEDRRALPGRAATNSAPVIQACDLVWEWARDVKMIEFALTCSHLLPDVPRSNTVMVAPAFTHNVLLLSAKVIVTDRAAQRAVAVAAGAGT